MTLVSMKKYKLVSKKGEGTFSEVIKAQNVKNGKFCAIKCMKSTFDSIEQVNNLREIQALRRLSPHPNVITLEEVLYDKPSGRLALVFEIMDMNLYELIQGRQKRLGSNLIRSYGRQLVQSLAHMHRKAIFHRDIKPENILIERSSKTLKLADFGSCRGVYSKPPFTEYISTRWYRAPECLLTEGNYNQAMDMWGVGCVLYEITTLSPLFPGNDEIDMLLRIHKILGSPSADVLAKIRKRGTNRKTNFYQFPEEHGCGFTQNMPKSSHELTDLITMCLKYDLTERISSEKAMSHPFCWDDKQRSRQKNQKKIAQAIPSMLDDDENDYVEHNDENNYCSEVERDGSPAQLPLHEHKNNAKKSGYFSSVPLPKINIRKQEKSNYPYMVGGREPNSQRRTNKKATDTDAGRLRRKLTLPSLGQKNVSRYKQHTGHYEQKGKSSNEPDDKSKRKAGKKKYQYIQSSGYGQFVKPRGGAKVKPVK